MSNELTKPPAFQVMQTDLQVSMDDVVSAFVSQYESNLFVRKKELTADIKAVEKMLSDNRKAVHQKVTGEEFTDYSLPFGLVIKLGEEPKIDWDKKKVCFGIKVELKDSSHYSNRINITRYKSIPASLVKTHKKLQSELADLRTDLSEVLVNLKSITRKERQVRGRIAMRKLEDSGYASLMQDEELIQLVQLDE